MVLDKQPNSVQFEPDPPPPSSPDLYSPTDSTVDFSPNYFNPFYPLKNDVRRVSIQRTVQRHAANIHRPLTPDESTALAYHAGNGYATAFWGTPIGATIACYRCYATRENFQAPILGALKSEKGWFDGERIQIMGREWLRGGSARLVVNVLRFVPHFFLAGLCATVGTTISGAFVSTSGILQDPRLKDFNADMRAKALEEQKNRNLRREANTERKIMPQGPKSAGELWKEHKGAIDGEARRDEGSSLASRDGMEYRGDEGMVGGGGFGAANSGGQTEQQGTRQQPVSRSTPWSNQTATESQPIGFTDHGYDSSPSAESGWSQEKSDGGSAWERVRRGAATPASGKKERQGATGGRGAGGAGSWQQQRDKREGSGSNDGDDFMFSSSEQERSYAQEEAQRDFDARVEKERQGGDFNEGGGEGGRRWG